MTMFALTSICQHTPINVFSSSQMLTRLIFRNTSFICLLQYLICAFQCSNAETAFKPRQQPQVEIASVSCISTFAPGSNISKDNRNDTYPDIGHAHDVPTVIHILLQILFLHKNVCVCIYIECIVCIYIYSYIHMCACIHVFPWALLQTYFQYTCTLFWTCGGLYVYFSTCTSFQGSLVYVHCEYIFQYISLSTL